MPLRLGIRKSSGKRGPMKARALAVCFLGVLFAVTVSGFAQQYTLTPPTGNALGFGAGGTRGDIVTMTGNYSLTSIGIDALILNGAQETFSAYVYNVVNGSGQNPLAVGAPVMFTGNGQEQFFTLPISFTLQAGTEYDIGIDFHSFNDPNLEVNFYFFDSSSNAPFSDGPFTVLDGEESHCGPCNVFAPNLQVNNSGGGTTPEPTSFLLLGSGLGLFGLIRRKINL
jgi:hypothetical protein